ncbi:hypothetical protein [Butyrivibrio sp. INlla16]|uniref:hypothetical protein n=1 Tax=Butyrivibrio sp. INlla16 TaxID=1520807 RepID=UPI000888527C|nr:hypothetical protein [Butyrivibrio sp. INlla16]SDB65230.1 hypothetical protein SAMN02910263_03692 [Butyrivibrio sp. INlla16]
MKKIVVTALVLIMVIGTVGCGAKKEDAEIIYGHMENNDFVPDHFDSISLFEELETGGYKIKAESDNGVQYTYQSSEEDADILEYYETWNEDEFSEKYSGGASLSRCD